MQKCLKHHLQRENGLNLTFQHVYAVSDSVCYVQDVFSATKISLALDKSITNGLHKGKVGLPE